jgi:hypothetical protein
VSCLDPPIGDLYENSRGIPPTFIICTTHHVRARDNIFYLRQQQRLTKTTTVLGCYVVLTTCYFLGLSFRRQTGTQEERLRAVLGSTVSIISLPLFFENISKVWSVVVQRGWLLIKKLEKITNKFRRASHCSALIVRDGKMRRPNTFPLFNLFLVCFFLQKFTTQGFGSTTSHHERVNYPSFKSSTQAKMSRSNASADPAPKMPVAVIGATGKLGREVVQQLSSRGMPVKCLIRQTEPPPYLAELSGVEFVKGECVACVCSILYMHTKSLNQWIYLFLRHLISFRPVQFFVGDVGDVDSLALLLSGTQACLAVYGATVSSLPCW